MKKIILLLSCASICSFTFNCSSDDDTDSSVLSYEKLLKEFEETSKILNDLNQNFITTNENIRLKPLEINTSPWDNRPIFQTFATRTITKNPANKKGYYSFVFKPDIAKKYGIPPGPYWCEFWTISARAELPVNTLASRALDTDPKGYLAFEPHNNKEELGVRYSTTANGSYQTITMSTNYFVIANDRSGFTVNKTIPHEYFRNGEFRFSYQYIQW